MLKISTLFLCVFIAIYPVLSLSVDTDLYKFGSSFSKIKGSQVKPIFGNLDGRLKTYSSASYITQLKAMINRTFDKLENETRLFLDDPKNIQLGMANDAPYMTSFFDSLRNRLSRGIEHLGEQKRNIIKKSSNFEKFGSKSLYFEINRQMNWFAAGNTCRSMGGHLVSIRNSQELNKILRHKNYSNNNPYWIDINDLAQEDQYVSSFSGRDTPFIKWADTEPNNYNGAEDCVDLYNFEMYDSKCENMYYFICEEDIDSCI